jgi:hypothetical protein
LLDSYARSDSWVRVYHEEHKGTGRASQPRIRPRARQVHRPDGRR